MEPCTFEQLDDISTVASDEGSGLLPRREKSWEKVLREMEFDSKVKCIASDIYRKLSKVSRKSSLDLLFYSIYCALYHAETPVDLLTLSRKFQFTIAKARTIVEYCLPLAVCPPPIIRSNPLEYLSKCYEVLTTKPKLVFNMQNKKVLSASYVEKTLSFTELEKMFRSIVSEDKEMLLRAPPQLISLMLINEYLDLFDLKINNPGEFYDELPFEVEKKIADTIAKNQRTD